MTDVSIYFYFTMEDWETVLLSEEHAVILADLFSDYTGRSEGGEKGIIGCGESAHGLCPQFEKTACLRFTMLAKSKQFIILKNEWFSSECE